MTKKTEVRIMLEFLRLLESIKGYVKAFKIPEDIILLTKNMSEEFQPSCSKDLKNVRKDVRSIHALQNHIFNLFSIG